MNESDLQNIKTTYGLSDDQINKVRNYPLKAQKEFLINLKNIYSSTHSNSINSANSFGGRVKVLSNSGKNSTKPLEVEQSNSFKFDEAAFIDTIILASITATFSLISFITILLYALK